MLTTFPPVDQLDLALSALSLASNGEMLGLLLAIRIDLLFLFLWVTYHLKNMSVLLNHDIINSTLFGI